ncbi:MAG: PKD domain-containing protein, partial [Acidobacteria bacterium]|nr:PKD domain-containing protein [Acidobacteriota bacterium]
HNGPSNDHANPNHPPSATDLTGSVASGGTLTLTLQASDADGDALQLRVVSQPAHGRAGVGGTTATYIPDPGFTGADSFTYAASDGMADSNLATVTVSVGPGSCTLSCSATVPDNGLVGDPVRFAAVATPNGCSGTPEYSWSFGDGSTSNVQNPQHTYDVSGTFTWTVTATLNGASCSKTGTIVIDNGGTCSVECSADVPSGAQPGETVQFAALATPNGCSGTPEYSWSFGDGSTSNVQNPQHAYDVSGAYTWTVTATLNGASCSKTGTIVIESGGTCSLECTADAPDSARVGQRVRFSSEVTPSEGCSGTPTLLWDFGDGSSSNRSDPRHTYRHTGSFSWTFTASLEGSTCAKDGTINVLRSGGDEHGGRHARVRAVAGSGSGSD